MRLGGDCYRPIRSVARWVQRLGKVAHRCVRTSETLFGRAVVLAVVPLLSAGCAGTPPAKAPPPSPETTTAISATPQSDQKPKSSRVDSQPAWEPATVHSCGQKAGSEEPVRVGKMGEGDRLVRLINNSSEPVQARLIDDDHQPVYQGTLRIPGGTTGEFKVPAGIYLLRYRRQKTCEVMRGAPLILKGKNAGVEISIKPKFESGSRSKMKPVGEAL